MTNDIQKKLAAEFPKGQVTFRPGAITKDKKKGLPLAYIDARDVMQRLDDVMGFDWKDEYYFNGERIMCRLSLKINDEWITREDGAGETPIESEKGALSDAFKRAAVKWGIGRYLYDLSFRYAPVDQWKKFIDNDFEMWKHQIKKEDFAKEEKERIAKELEEKRKRAEAWVNDYLLKHEALYLLEDNQSLIDLKTDNAAMLKRIAGGYPDLHKEITTKTNEIRNIT